MPESGPYATISGFHQIDLLLVPDANWNGFIVDVCCYVGTVGANAETPSVNKGEWVVNNRFAVPIAASPT